jgi:dGTPase
VAYINHDIDDAIRAGMLEPQDLPPDCVDVLGRSHSGRITTMVTDIVHTSDGSPDVGMSSRVADATDRLKEFLFERVYWNPVRGGVELEKARRVVTDLFHLYMDQPEKIPSGDSLKDVPMEERAQAVCDYVAGMTDRYALSRFVRHFLPRGLPGVENA